MQKYLLAIIVGLGLSASAVYFALAKPVAAAQNKQSSTNQSSVAFNADGTVNVPDPHVFRRWVFVGAPLTPEGLNNGKFNCDQPGGCTKSNFPEYHHVYIEQKNVDAYLKTGEFPEGTVIVKELTRVLDPKFPDGSRKEASGRGYFNGAYNGIDMSIKDSKRFAKTNGWGFFTFGHHPLPYDKTSVERPVAECAGCHIANVSDTDMTWIQFYPLLRDKDPK
ncbi:MAG TPA: cytochrome P460 family protein [Candidatus Sulfotelmatobacter sp.]